MKTLTLIAFLFILGLGANGQTQTNGTTIIEIDLARFVASQHVQRNNQPFEWRSVDYMVLHDTEGDVQGYAFVFAKAETDFRSPADLQRHIKEKSDRLREAREKVATAKPEAQTDGQTPGAVVEAEENFYNFNDIATVITGGRSDSPLILRHFRGLPEFWVEAEALDSPASARLYGRSLQASRVIMITPMDFRLATSEGAERVLTKTDLRSAQKASIPDSALVLKIHGKSLEEMSAVRKARHDIEAHKQKRLTTIKPVDRQKYEQALQDRAKALAAEWEGHRQLWLKAEADRGAVR